MEQHYCSQCGKLLEENDKFCSQCGAAVVTPIEDVQEIQHSKKRLPKLILWVLLISLVVAIVAVVARDPFHFYTLPEKEQKCYELMLDVSREFKNPSSVRIISGEFNFYPNTDPDYCSACLKLSASNGYGAITSGYYFVGYEDNGNLFIYDLEYYGEYDEYINSLIEECYETNSFDVKKVNSALAKYWNDK